LRDAIVAANAFVSVGDTIAFDPLVFSTPLSIPVLSGEMKITDDLTILGPGFDKVTIGPGALSRYFNIDGTSSFSGDPTLTVSISGLTLSGATASGAGGAILVNNESVTVSDCKFDS